MTPIRNVGQAEERPLLTGSEPLADATAVVSATDSSRP